MKAVDFAVGLLLRMVRGEVSGEFALVMLLFAKDGRLMNDELRFRLGRSRQWMAGVLKRMVGDGWLLRFGHGDVPYEYELSPKGREWVRGFLAQRE